MRASTSARDSAGTAASAGAGDTAGGVWPPGKRGSVAGGLEARCVVAGSAAQRNPVACGCSRGGSSVGEADGMADASTVTVATAAGGTSSRAVVLAASIACMASGGVGSRRVRASSMRAAIPCRASCAPSSCCSTLCRWSSMLPIDVARASEFAATSAATGPSCMPTHRPVPSARRSCAAAACRARSAARQSASQSASLPSTRRARSAAAWRARSAARWSTSRSASRPSARRTRAAAICCACSNCRARSTAW